MKTTMIENTAAAPPLTVVGMTFAGVPLDDWLKLLGVAWLLLQIGHFVWVKFIRKDKDK
jgi:hypothetical protein